MVHISITRYQEISNRQPSIEIRKVVTAVTTQLVKKAAIYCRVSVFNKSKTGFSTVEEQEKILKEYCKRKGWDIYKVFTIQRLCI